MAYKAELARYGATREDADLIGKCEEVVNASAVTLLESQLCRQLKKETVHARGEGCEKYLALYASVPQESVLKALWEAAQEAVAKKNAMTT